MVAGRITKGIGGIYFVSTDEGVFKCKIRGVFKNRNIVPIVGDFVIIEKENFSVDTGIIVHIEDRYNELIRPKVSNVNQGIIVFSSLNPDINYDLLDKFIIYLESKEINVIICINKIDLINYNSIKSMEEIYKKIGYEVFYCSIFNEDSISKFKVILENKVSVFAGVSGVGKSSLINSIIPKANAITGKISEKNKKGKHTTRHSELLTINSTSFILDTPGFSTISLEDIPPENLKYLFIEFRKFNDLCKFSNCNHINEPNCAVRDNINVCIFMERYSRYKNIFLELSNKG